MKSPTDHLKRNRRLGVLLMSLLSFSLNSNSHANDEAPSDTIYLKNDENISGRLLGREAGFVVLEIASDSGQVIRRINPQDVQAIRFAGSVTAPQANNATHENLRAMAERRAPFLGIISSRDEAICIDFLKSEYESGNYSGVINQTKQWTFLFADDSNHLASRELLIKACSADNRPEEAFVHSRKWIEDGYSFDQSAIAWASIARFHNQANQPEKALVAALIPITNREAKPYPYLDLCYEEAISAATCLDAEEYVRALVTERNTGKPTELETPVSIPSLTAFIDQFNS